MHLAIDNRHLFGARVTGHVDAFGDESSLQKVSGFALLDGQRSVRALDHVHVRSIATENLRQLDTNSTDAEDNQAARQLGGVYSLAVGPHGYRLDTAERWQRGGAPGGDDHCSSGDRLPPVQVNLARASQAALTAENSSA